MSRILRIGAVCAAAVLPLALVGCGKVAEKSTEKMIEDATGGNVDINTDDGSFTFSDGNGSIAYGEDVKLPSDFPSSVPTPSDATLVSAFTTNGEYTLGYKVSDWSSAFTAYTNKLESGGFTQSFDASTGAMSTRTYEDSKHSVNVIAGDDSEGGYLTVIVTQTTGSSGSGMDDANMSDPYAGE